MNTRIVVTVLLVVTVAVHAATATTGFTLITANPLTAALSNITCGNTKYCASLPPSCDPNSQGCYFASAQPGKDRFLIELSGNSTGYIAASVSPDNITGNNDTTYICANGNKTVDFYTALLSNTTLIPANLTVIIVNGTTGNITQCIINVPPINATFVNIYSGSYNSTDHDVGDPKFVLQLNFTSLLNSTSPPNTTSPNYGTTIQQSLTQALLITAGVLGLTMM